MCSIIDSSGSRGTIKYVGEVNGVQGLWFGIDWDDPKRGKHDGTYNDIRYFTASHPTSGSFVRPCKVSTGISIVEAIKERYGLTSDPNVGLDQEIIIQVQKEIKAKIFEVVGAEKLNRIQSDFRNLRIVLLRDFLVNGAGPPQALLNLCPSIQELDLSRTLLNSWESVEEITSQLKNLKILNLSNNRLKISENVVKSESFQSLEHIVLGNLMYSWFQVLECSNFFLNIQALQVQFNNIVTLETPNEKIFSNLCMLDLEGNPIKSWNEINKIGYIKTLETLNISQCGIDNIYLPVNTDSSQVTDLFKNLKNLILNGNNINDWESISELDKLENLYDFRFKDNPILTIETMETNHQLIITKIRNLQVLNGEQILKEERKGADIDYLKRYGREWLGIKNEEDKKTFIKAHPCYLKLISLYGPPEECELKKLPTSLKSQLIQIEIFSGDKKFSKKVPYNMSIQKLSGLIQRLFNTGFAMPRLFCIHSQRRDSVEIPLDDILKDLNFYSVENGDKIAVHW
ncbi:tubulin-specific chaperone E, putative [Pediculus humanus corporis]|uniref:Tubulin-specific chaperone E n=1 Tax=Pediculus humanus subsp. corporis TaxID=121224 RepID=E0VEM4_PEDHC|nr:tubulin-specific chaperone E, putative [Pediculus humanus corporis]EEB11830.1 tubulin-specific chaperone E, putative [Pediculus humanus corporis]